MIPPTIRNNWEVSRCLNRSQVNWSSHFEARKAAFIEDSTLRDDELLGDRIVEAPTFVSCGVANKYTLLHVRLQ